MGGISVGGARHSAYQAARIALAAQREQRRSQSVGFVRTDAKPSHKGANLPAVTTPWKRRNMLWKLFGLQRLLDELFDERGWLSLDLPRTAGWDHDDVPAPAQD